MLQHSHDVRLRQLLREYLLREDTGVAGAPLLPTRGANSTTASAVNLGSSSSSSLRAGLPVPVTAGSGNSDSEKDGAPAVVPIDGGGSSSSSLVPTAVALQAPGAATDSSSSPGSSSNSSSELSVVYHPCLHEGYEAVYNRVAYGGITPNPAQVGSSHCELGLALLVCQPLVLNCSTQSEGIHTCRYTINLVADQTPLCCLHTFSAYSHM
jgi:hypothetical protein